MGFLSSSSKLIVIFVIFVSIWVIFTVEEEAYEKIKEKAPKDETEV
ncbi:hypothetical protein SLEP1_g31931 [Rubroshorea leprosula]|uniref:Uncharacterized protein n=1 Tax=Rubroshorea leprosula TaxID=152421 RepID=A0AAV5KBS8_9ROSI|nr:hypothetical protein SLEP1_g31931 [Rubroshorea leprosula]